MPASSPEATWTGIHAPTIYAMHIRIQTFWDKLNYNQVILLQIFNKLPAPLETNSQMTGTCLAHTFF